MCNVTYTDQNKGEIIFDCWGSPNPWFDYVGMVPPQGVTLLSALDNNPTPPGHNTWSPDTATLAGVTYNTFLWQSRSNPWHITQHITVYYKGTISNTPELPQFIAHVAWGTSSAKFYGGTITPPHSIPEFPTMVLPVAAILGIMIIFGRRKKD